MPAIMGDFRQEARTAAPIRDLFDYPNTQTIVTDFIDVDVGRMPTLAELTALLLEQTTPILGYLLKQLVNKLIQSANTIPPNTENVEEECLKHLYDFVGNHATTADRSLCDVSNNNSSQFSLPLALGVLSPRQVYHRVKDEQKSQEERGCSLADINWLISHMEMRDYFLFIASAKDNLHTDYKQNF